METYKRKEYVTYITRFCRAAYKEFDEQCKKEENDKSIGAKLNVFKSTKNQRMNIDGEVVSEGDIHVVLEIRLKDFYKRYDFSDDVLLFSATEPEDVAKYNIGCVFSLMRSYVKNQNRWREMLND